MLKFVALPYTPLPCTVYSCAVCLHLNGKIVLLGAGMDTRGLRLKAEADTKVQMKESRKIVHGWECHTLDPCSAVNLGFSLFQRELSAVAKIVSKHIK